MLAIRLPEDIEQRLAHLAEKTGRSKTYYAKEAILRYLEDLEDTYIAIERLEHPGRLWSNNEVIKELGLEKEI